MVYEKILVGRHPIKAVLPTEQEMKERVYRNLKFKRSSSGGTFYGLVTNVRVRFDKHGNEMAFFGLMGGDGFFIDVVCFGSIWSEVKTLIKSRELLKITVDKKYDSDRGSFSHIYNGGPLFKIKKEKKTND